MSDESPITFDCKASGQNGFGVGEVASTLRSMGHKDSHGNGGGHQAVAFKPSHFTRGKDGAPSEVVAPLSADADNGDQESVIAFKPGSSADARSIGAQENLACTLEGGGGGNNKQAVSKAMAVRRLTHRECERLQGFQWLCQPTDPGAWQDEASRWWSPDWTAGFSDSTRYKMLGNAVAVPVAEWIAKRMAAVLERLRTHGGLA